MIRNSASLSRWWSAQIHFGLVLGWVLHLPTAVAQPGTLDTSFDPGSGVDQSVFAMAVQDDGRIIIVGDFTTVNGIPRGGIARLSNNGALDTNFNSGSGANDLVNAVALQTNKTVIAGYFTEIDGTPRGRIARLNSNGSLDTNFAAGPGASGPVLALAIQADGKVVVGGVFTNVQGTARTNIARLNSDGSADTGFNPGTGVSSPNPASVKAIALQTDGKIILGGAFTSVNGTVHTNLARLNSDGSVDGSFNPSATGGGVLAGVNTLAVQSDGRIVVGGDFTGINGMAKKNIARLNANGTLDTNFLAGLGPDDAVSSLAVQSNGKIVLGGYFNYVNAAARTNVARLNSDGSLDSAFTPGAGTDYPVYVTALQSDGQVLIGGLFATFDATPRSGIARLNGDAIIPSPQLLSPVRSSNTLRVSLPTSSGHAYVLEYENVLANGNWSEILPSVAGDGPVKTLAVSSATGPQRMYRVRVD